VTEEQWLACEDPERMLEFLRGKASERKLRLFAVACMRRVGHLLIEKQSMEAVELAEEFAEGRVSKADLTDKRKQLNNGVKGGGTGRFLTAARRSARVAGWTEPKAGAVSQAWTWAWSGSRELMRVDTVQAALEVAVAAECSAANNSLDSIRNVKALEAARSDEKATQAALLRCVFGRLPFRHLALGTAWLVWNDRTVPQLAQAIYDERASLIACLSLPTPSKKRAAPTRPSSHTSAPPAPTCAAAGQ
jgi:hypothetical protein